MHPFQQIAQRIKENIVQKEVKNEKVLFQGGEYSAFPLIEDNFIVLDDNLKSKNASLSPSLSQQKIAFIDGGNAELLKTPGFSLQFIRVAACVFQANKSITMEQYEYYVLISAVENENDIYYEVDYFSSENNQRQSNGKMNETINEKILPRKEDLCYYSYDKTIVTGVDRGEISKMGEICRKFSELLLAKKIAQELQENDLVVLDNSLKSYYTNEEIYWQQLFTVVTARKMILAGLTKTTTLLTDKGNSVISVLHLLSEKKQLQDKCWYYYPVVSITKAIDGQLDKHLQFDKHPAEILFVKLHKLANYIFKLEIYNQSFRAENLQLLLSMLQLQANDAFFVGYPYGLVKVDQFARVSNKEKEYLQVLFMANAGQNYAFIKQALSASNAHGILDGKS